MTGPRKLLDPAKLEEAALQVAALAAGSGIRVALLGGMAMQIYGSDRLTGDIDFVADAVLADLPKGKPLSFGGEQTRTRSGVPVDLIVRDDEFQRLYEDALSSAPKLRGPGPLAGIRIVSPEYLAAMKMLAGRRRDHDDLEFLILHKLDTVKARKIIAKHLGPFAAREFDANVLETRWAAKRERS